MIDHRQRLQQFIQTRCIQRGTFKLASGRETSWYADLRPLALSPLVVDWYHVARGLLVTGGFIDGDYAAGTRFDAVGGVETGGNALVGAYLARHAATLPGDFRADNPFWLDGFVVRKALKGHGQDGWIVGTCKPTQQVVLFEDVTTTGNSLVRAIEHVTNLTASVVAAITILDRNDGTLRSRLDSVHGVKFYAMFRPEDYGLKASE